MRDLQDKRCHVCEDYLLAGHAGKHTTRLTRLHYYLTDILLDLPIKIDIILGGTCRVSGSRVLATLSTSVCANAVYTCTITHCIYCLYDVYTTYIMYILLALSILLTVQWLELVRIR